MKDYSAMTDFEINKLVAESLGNSNVTLPLDALSGSVISYSVYVSSGLNRDGSAEAKSITITKDFCNRAADAWPIIESKKICLAYDVFAEETDGGRWTVGSLPSLLRREGAGKK